MFGRKRKTNFIGAQAAMREHAKKLAPVVIKDDEGSEVVVKTAQQIAFENAQAFLEAKRLAAIKPLIKVSRKRKKAIAAANSSPILLLESSAA